jgi:hypothetical protein
MDGLRFAHKNGFYTAVLDGDLPGGHMVRLIAASAVAGPGNASAVGSSGGNMAASDDSDAGTSD